MTELISLATATAHPGRVDDLVRELQARIEPTRAQPGNLEFTLQIAAPPAPAAVVRAYLGAWQIRDFPAMRCMVADDLRFTGPIDTFDRADAHHTAIKALSDLVDHVHIDRLWSDG